jgi:hypothetical protein
VPEKVSVGADSTRQMRHGIGVFGGSGTEPAKTGITVPHTVSSRRLA